MGHFKSFFLGMLTAYGVYFITRKGADGRSILEDLLDHPDRYIKEAKDGFVEDAGKAIREIVK